MVKEIRKVQSKLMGFLNKQINVCVGKSMILKTAWVSFRCCNLAGASEDEDSGFYQ